MTPSYFSRLLMLSSASFFIVQLAVGGLISLIAPVAIRRARCMRPVQASRFLLTLRLLPAAMATILVAALCVPSYLRFEPVAGEEDMGLVCFTAAIFGGWIFALAICRSLGALTRSRLYVRRCRGVEARAGGERILIVRQGSGLALAGILRPRLLISEDALRELTPDQLAVALRHERAHLASRDNLKRLLIQLAPAVFPALRSLERAWAKCAEWAADDWAAEGDADRSAALAEALVRVARLQSGVAAPYLVTLLVEADEDLRVRVGRLLETPPGPGPDFRGRAISIAGALLFVAAAAIHPASLRLVHALLERLLD